MSQSFFDDPISRRTALSAIGAGITGFHPWSAAIRAADKMRPDFSFIVVSDTHIGRDDKSDAADLWQKTAKEIDAASGDFVLHLGDVVDGGREKQYGVYKEIRKTIRKPVYEIPGNHDPQQLFARHICQDIDRSFDHRGVRFILMNNSRFKSVDGFITSSQIQWLTQQCSEAHKAGQFIILAMHVPVHANNKPDPGFFVRPADGQTALYALLNQHSDRMLAMFHGHFHCGLRGWSDHGPLQEIIFPSALYNKNYQVTEQKAPGYNLPEFRPGFTLAKLDGKGLTLAYQPVGVAENRMKICELKQLAS